MGVSSGQIPGFSASSINHLHRTIYNRMHDFDERRKVATLKRYNTTTP